jgi:DNA modification methylase
MNIAALPTPYYQDDAVVIYHGDGREILPLLADDSADLVLTDPPYGVDKADWDDVFPVWWLDDAARIAPVMGVMPGVPNLLSIPRSTLYRQNSDAGRVVIGRDTKPDHPSPKPYEAMRWLVSSLPGNVILDPFMGSGTTLRAAKDLGRRAIGIELEERYCEIAAKRMAQTVLPLGELA